MLRRRLSALVLLLLTLSACTQANGAPKEDATANAVQTALSSVSPTNTSAVLPTIAFLATPTSTTPVALASTATPTAEVLPSDFSPVLLGKNYGANMFFALLGGVQAGQWISPDQAFINMTGASAYDVYAFGSGPHQVYGYAPGQSRVSQDYFLGTDATLNENGMIGVAPGWQVTHRVPEELPSNNDVYRQLILDLLAQSGVANPQTGTMHIYRVDLEGDGSDEIFISDTRVEGQHGVVAGDHSIILMRKVSGNGAVTVPILVDLYAAIGYGNPFPCTYDIANFVDLNQDGVMEVIVQYDRWEAFGASVHQVNGERAEQVLGATCINP